MLAFNPRDGAAFGAEYGIRIPALLGSDIVILKDAGSDLTYAKCASTMKMTGGKCSIITE